MELNLAETIKNARENKKISQRELSRRTGIDNNTISQIEKGERKKPNSLSLIKLSQALDLSLETLMVASGYTEYEIDMAYSANPAFEFGAKLVRNTDDLIAHVEEQILKVEESIRKLKESKKNHSDSAYLNMSKEDIKFFDEQADELIKMDKEILKVYKKRLDTLNHLYNKNLGFTAKKYGIDVLEVNDDKIN